MSVTTDERPQHDFEPHHAARPMKVVVDTTGCHWLCDDWVDEGKNLKEQGCWRHVDMPFTRDD